MTTAGNVAFAAYKKSVKGVTYDGKPIPNWMLLSQSVRYAWEAAGMMAQQAVGVLEILAAGETALADDGLLGDGDE